MKQSVYQLSNFRDSRYKMQEVTSQHSVYYPMIVRQRQVHFMPDCNRITLRSFYNSRFLLKYHLPTQDSNLRLINDWRTEQALECTKIGYRKCTPINIFRH